MADTRVLVIEDEARYQRLIQFNLETDGHQVDCVGSGAEAFAWLANGMPDLVILDIMLPGQDGFEICQRIRDMSMVPIIMLTALGRTEDKIKGLEFGADDYVTKPFSAQELLARVGAVLRRAHLYDDMPEQTRLSFEDLHIDLLKHLVTLGHQEVKLSPTEFRTLQYLATHAGKVLSQKDILGHVWGANYRIEHDVLRVTISRLRNKIGDDSQHPRFIKTLPGVGYVMADPR